MTLTGPGGIGKTRLSIEVARRLGQDPGWDACFVTLSSITQLEDAMPAIAEALGLWDTQRADLISRLSRLLESQQLLLVLDNLEHVIDIAVDLAELLAAIPGITILATSRSPLHIQGEREYSVPQLTVANPGTSSSLDELLASESVALFVDRARAINQDFTIDESNAGVIAEICARLDGLPLAIELAAARTKALPPQALLRRLDNQLGILRSEARDLPRRMRAIRATIDWSYNLLEPEEQQAFRHLSIFAGDFSLNAATAVLDESENLAIDTVTSLIDKSLLISRPPSEDVPYFRMLAAVREFGLEQLRESGHRDIVMLRQADYFADLVERLYPGQFGAEQADVFFLLDRKHDNIRQALGWAVETERWELAARIAGRLWQYWNVRGHLAEGIRWLDQLLTQDFDYPVSLLPGLYYGRAILVGNREEAAQNLVLSRRLHRIAAATGDRRVLATAHNIAGLSFSSELSMGESIASYEVWLEIGETVRAGMAAGLASRWARESGDLELAQEYAERSYDLLRYSGHHWGTAIALLGIGRVLQLRGRLEEAATRLREGLDLVGRVGDRIVVFRFLEYIFEIAATWDQFDGAIQLASASTRMREVVGYGIRYPTEQAALERYLERARLRLGDERFERLWQQGERLNLDQAISLARSIKPADAAAPVEVPTSSIRLTRRELEVLQRIVAGHTDQQIADELFVSYRTVTTHVTNILNKLGAGSRTEAAAIAVREGLVTD